MPVFCPYSKRALLGEEGEAAGVSDETSAVLDMLLGWNGLWIDEDADGWFDSPATLVMDRWLRILAKAILLDDIGEEHFVRFAAPGYPDKAVAGAISVSAGIKAIVYTARQLLDDGSPSYDFFNGEDCLAVFRDTFQQTVKQLVSEHGADVSAWRNQPSPFVFRVSNFRGVPQALPSSEQRLPVIQNRGSENNIFIARNGALAGSDVVPPGQSGFIDPQGNRSAHFDDQLKLYNEFGRKFLPLDREEVTSRGQSRLVLSTRSYYAR